MNRKVYNSSNKEVEQKYSLRSSFQDSFTGEVSGLTDLDDADSIKYEVLSGIKAKVSDKVDNIASGFVGIAQPEQEGIEEGFSTKGGGINTSKVKVAGKSGQGFNLFCAPSVIDHVLNPIKGFFNGYEIGKADRFLGVFLLGRCPNSYFPVQKVDLWGEVKITVPYGNSTRTIRLQPITRRTAYLNDVTGFTYGKESIWYGSVRNLSQIYDKTKSFDTIYNSSESGRDSINNVFARAPFATNGTGKLTAEVNFENKVAGYRDRAHVEYYFSIKNQHPDYNDKFLSNRNPYQTDNERKIHIRERHDINFLNPYQFFTGYKLINNLPTNFKDNSVNIRHLTVFDPSKDSTDMENGSRKLRKGVCFPKDSMDTDTKLDLMYKRIDSIANMEDINDYWDNSQKGALLIQGKRDNYNITTWVNINGKSYDYGTNKQGTAFPYKAPFIDIAGVDSMFKSFDKETLRTRFNSSLDYVQNNNAPSKGTNTVYDDYFDNFIKVGERAIGFGYKTKLIPLAKLSPDNVPNSEVYKPYSRVINRIDKKDSINSRVTTIK